VAEVHSRVTAIRAADNGDKSRRHSCWVDANWVGVGAGGGIFEKRQDTVHPLPTPLFLPSQISPFSVPLTFYTMPIVFFTTSLGDFPSYDDYFLCFWRCTWIGWKLKELNMQGFPFSCIFSYLHEIKCSDYYFLSLGYSFFCLFKQYVLRICLTSVVFAPVPGFERTGPRIKFFCLGPDRVKNDGTGWNLEL